VSEETSKAKTESSDRGSRSSESSKRDQSVGKSRKIDDDDVWGERAHEVATNVVTETTMTEQQTTKKPASSWTDSMQVDNETSKKLQTGALLASVAGFVYFLCLRKGEPGPGPRRRYGSLGAKDPDADSDGDDIDDPRERRRMLELSSFGEGSGEDGSGGAYRRARKGGSTAKTSDKSSSSANRGSFPLASFGTSSNSSASSGSVAQKRDISSNAGG